MSNATINTCANRSSGPPGSPGRTFDASLYAKQVLPFVDMTVKGWVWCECLCLSLSTLPWVSLTSLFPCTRAHRPRRK